MSGTTDPNARQIGGRHYKVAYEHWDWVTDLNMGYLEGCATKYIYRWREKNGVADVQKAYHYLEKAYALATRHINSYTNTAVLNSENRNRTLRFVSQMRDASLEERIIFAIVQWDTPVDLQICMRLVQDLEEVAKSVKPDQTGQDRPFGYPGEG